MWAICKVFTESATILLSVFHGLSVLVVRHAGTWFPNQECNLHALCWEANS